jgi:transposase
MATIVTVGLDTSKSWFQAHGADAAGGTVLRTKLARSKVLTFFANLQPCLIGMEACGERQSMLMLHRIRDLLIRQRTASVNALRGHLAEYGILAEKESAKAREL